MPIHKTLRTGLQIPSGFVRLEWAAGEVAHPKV